jgi:hypothetical protein
MAPGPVRLLSIVVHVAAIASGIALALVLFDAFTP